MSSTHRLSRLRFPTLAAAIVTLLVAMWYGLVRLGWQVQLSRPDLLVEHGPLMVTGFLGTLIGVERAVAVGKRIGYIPPALTGLGGLALIVGVPGIVGPGLITVGSLGLTILFMTIVRHHFAWHTVTMALGVVVWLVGNGLWVAGLPVYRVVPWWTGFLVLTIAGERLELSRLLRPSSLNRGLFALAVGLFLSGITAGLFAFDVGSRLAGAGLAAIALWLLRYDIARRTVRKTGLTRFIAICLLGGYVWLGIGGLLGLRFGGVAAGLRYDAILHAAFLGFVFSVIFGHAPIIFPSVLGSDIFYHPVFYAHFLLLHLSLTLRISGDLTGWMPGRLWGGLFNVLAVLLFLGVTGWSLWRAKTRPASVGGASMTHGELPE